MAITVTEQPLGRDISGSSAQRLYIVAADAAENEAEALAGMLLEVPTSIAGLDLDIDGTGVDEIADGMWLGRAIYKSDPDEDPATNDAVYSFDTGEVSERVTNYIAGTYTGYPATARDFKGAIHANPYTFEVAGTTVPAPVFNFSETHYIDDDEVDADYIAELFKLAWHINNAEWTDSKGHTFKAGELLLKRIHGGQRGRGDWELMFDLAGRPNQEGLVFGDITVTSAKGWDYLWVLYKPDEDDTAKGMVAIPEAVYVGGVFPVGDFSKLKINT